MHSPCQKTSHVKKDSCAKSKFFVSFINPSEEKFSVQKFVLSYEHAIRGLRLTLMQACILHFRFHRVKSFDFFFKFFFNISITL